MTSARSAEDKWLWVAAAAQKLGVLVPVVRLGLTKRTQTGREVAVCSAPDLGRGPPMSDKVRETKEDGLQLSITNATPHTQARDGWRWDRGQRSSLEVTRTQASSQRRPGGLTVLACCLTGQFSSPPRKRLSDGATYP